MTSASRRLGASVLALLSLCAVAALLSPPAAAAAAQDGWTVTTDTTLSHTDFAVAGELRVARGATLTLDDVDLTISPGLAEAPALIIEAGGRIVAKHSTISSRSDKAADAVAVTIEGSADISSTTFRGIAADASRPVEEGLPQGMAIPWGGVVIRSSDVILEDVRVERAVGCGLSVELSSPTLRGLVIAEVSPRSVGSAAFAAGICLEGGRVSIDGLRAWGLGTDMPLSASALYAAAVVANAPDRLAITAVDLRSPAVSTPEGVARITFGVLAQNAGDFLVDGGTISGLDFGVFSASPNPPLTASATQVSALYVVQVVSGPINETGSWSGTHTFSASQVEISGSLLDCIHFESQASSAVVTATADNVTVANCKNVGVYLGALGGTGSHTFNVWSSNATYNGAHGFYLRGGNLGAGLSVNMADNGAYMNGGPGISVETSYPPASTRIGSAKLEFNVANNNSINGSKGFYGGGIFLLLGSPSNMNLRYLNNTANGNGNASGQYYGHYIQVAATNPLNILTGWISGITALNNSHYGFGVAGGGGLGKIDMRTRFDWIAGNPKGIQGSYSRVEVWNSTLGNTAELEGSETDFILVGSQHTRLAGTTNVPHTIISYKWVSVRAVWQNGAPLALFPLRFKDGNNSDARMWSDVASVPPTVAGSTTTDSSGVWSGYVSDWIFDTNLPPASQTVNYAPLSIIAQKFETAARSTPFDLQTNVVGTIVFFDPNPPTLLLTAPRENGTYTSANLSVRGNVSDDLSGVAGLQVSLDGFTWSDLPPPYGTFSYSFGTTADGIYDVWVRTWDNANIGLDPRAETLVVLYSITIDTQPPSVTLSDPPLADGAVYWVGDTPVIFFRGNVDPSVVQLFLNGQPVTLTGTVFLTSSNLTSDGPYSFLFLALDGAGNARTIKISVIKDSIPPTLIMTAPQGSGDLYANSLQVTIAGITDSNARVYVNNVEVIVADFGFSSLTTLVEGRNVVNVRAVDAAGNVNNRTLVVIVDTRAPQVTVLNHTEGEGLNTSRVNLLGTLSEHVDYVEINLRIFPVGAVDWAATLGLQEGLNTLSINATDRAGNKGTLLLHLLVDTQPPLVVVFALPEFLVVSRSPLSVHGNVSEDAAVTVNGQAVSLNALQFDTSLPLTEGDTLVTITARDGAGNVATLVRHITLDTHPPNLTITSPTNGQVVSARLLQLTGFTERNATVKVGTQVIAVDASGSFVAYVPLDSLGANSLVVNVSDAAGNSAFQILTVRYEPTTVDTLTPLLMGAAAAVALCAGLGGAGWFLAKRRTEKQVSDAMAAQGHPAPAGGVPGYMEAPQPINYNEASPGEYGQASEGYEQPAAAGYEQPPVEGAEQPRAPRPPRPPRAPTS